MKLLSHAFQLFNVRRAALEDAHNHTLQLFIVPSLDLLASCNAKDDLISMCLSRRCVYGGVFPLDLHE